MGIMALKPEVQPKVPLPPLLKTAYTTKHQKRMKSAEEKKASRKEFDRLRGKTRVNIGAAFQRWRDRRNLLGLKTDAELALLLLNSFPKTGTLSFEQLEARGADWSSSDESLVGATGSRNCESAAWDENLMAEDGSSSAPSGAAPMEIELELTRSMTNKPLAESPEPMKLHSNDVQIKSSTAYEEENCRLSESSYVTLSKEVLLFLMYRCLECSSECSVEGRGKGGSLSLRQECLTCPNSRVWTSEATDIAKNKVDDISLILSCDDVGLQVSENVFPTADQRHTNAKQETQTHQDESCIKTAQDEPAAQDFISSFKVKEELNDEKAVDKSPLMEADEEAEAGQRENGVENNDDALNIVKSETSTPPDRDPDHQGMFIGEDGRLKPAEEASDKSSKKRQHEDSDASVRSSSYEGSSGEESEVEPFKKSQKPFQNTIKPMIWCADCESVAKMLCTVRRHRRIYGCRECGSGGSEETAQFKDFSVHFSDIVSFHKHAMAMHGATENPYEHTVCPDCKKSIRVETTPNNNKGHICKYKLKPFACDLCRKRFFTENGQKVHHRRLHGDYTHICKYCMMAFNTKPSKLDHEQTHSQDALPYICPDCPEKFKDFVARNQHLKTHRGQKKFVCHTCNRRFVSLQRYERHMRIHSGEKPYTCEVCERSFNQDGHLKSHMRLHTGEKPFMCERCGECFNHNVSLKNHLQRQHGIDPSRMPAEDSRPLGRPLRKCSSNQDRRKKQRRRSSTPSGAAEEEEEEEVQRDPDLDSQSESLESDSDEEAKKRGRKRKTTRRTLLRSREDK